MLISHLSSSLISGLFILLPAENGKKEKILRLTNIQRRKKESLKVAMFLAKLNQTKQREKYINTMKG